MTSNTELTNPKAHYFKKYKWWFLAGAVALIVTNLLGLAIPAQIGQAVQTIRSLSDAPTPDLHDQLILAGQLIIALAIGSAIARILSRILIFNAGRFIEYDIRNLLYQKLTTLDASFFQKYPTGDITSRVTNDVSYIRLLYAISFLHIINTSVAYIISTQKMWAISPTLTLLCLAPYPFLVFGLRFIIRAIFSQTKLVQEKLAELSNKVQENLSGITVVKTFNLAELETKNFAEQSEEYYGHGIKLAMIRGSMTLLTSLISGLAVLLVIWFGSQQVLDNTMQLGDFIEFNGYVVALAFPTTALGWVFSVWHRGLAAFERVEEVLNHQPDLQDPESPSTLPHPSSDRPCGHIKLTDVSFSYDPEQTPTLQHITIDIPPGSRIAIVGKTGSGKSTLLKLIARMMDPQQGSITLDGVDLTRLTTRSLRSELGLVPQDPFLFSMTIGQNLRFGLDSLMQDPSLARSISMTSLIDPESGEKEPQELLEEAIQIAGLTQDIDFFPQGLDTMVGERGITLSGGQKQRVTIARALLTKPRVLLLDDALSSVDTQTEAQILEHLDDLMRDRTSILVTHRYSALSSMDHIFVMDDGQIVEQGTHQELLSKQGVYTQMVTRQQIKESLESSSDAKEVTP